MPVSNDLWSNMMKSAVTGTVNGPAPSVTHPLADNFVGQNGAPGFAQGIDRDHTLSPFAFTTSKPLDVSDILPIPMGNFLKDLFKEVAPKLLRFPSATRNPLEMKGQKGWSELVDPVSSLIPETVAPLGPISPDTRQRKLIPSRRGVQGISSHLNLIVDCSYSMRDYSEYAVLEDSKGRVAKAGGRMSARFVAALLIEQAKALGDSFSVFTFGGPVGDVQSLTRGASRDYRGVVDYLLTSDDEFRTTNNQVDVQAAPFATSNGTPLVAGLAACCSTMVMNRDKIRGALTIVIIDGEPNGISGSDPRLMPNGNIYGWSYGQFGSYIFSSRGAARNLITEWDYENLGVPKTELPADAWNPRDDPRMWLNEERLRREFGPVLYVVVGSGDDEASVQEMAAGFNMALQSWYNGTNLGMIRRSRTVIDRNGDSRTEYQTEVVMGNDRRVGLPGRDGWSPWTFRRDPPAGTDSTLIPGWTAASIRGPCSACSNSFTISSGLADISRFGGDLLKMARAGKGGDLQRLCFTATKRR